MSNIIQVEGKEIVVKEWQGERVITVWDISNLHNKEVKRIGEIFRNNKSRFELGRDYYTLNREEFFGSFKPFQNFIPNNVKEIPLFTERGYLKLVKPFTDDLSWRIQDILIESYFKIKEIVENNYKVPKSFKEALLLAVEQQEEIERLELENKEKQNQLEEQKPMVDFFETVTESEDTLDFKQVATTLKFEGIGRTKLMIILREQGIINWRNEPYQKYVNLGYFKTVEKEYNDVFGNTRLSVKTVVFQKGVDFINRLLIKLGKTKKVGGR